MSKLYFRYGAMNSGKSTALLQVAHNYEERGMNVIVLKPATDTKANNYVSSRLGTKRKVDFLISYDESIPIINNVNCILVDESQFLSEQQVDELYEIAKINEIPVICYGLRTDFKTNFFEGSKRLMELADDIEELKTICRCGKKATFNARKINNKFVFEGNQVEIDNQDNIEYESLCGTCYILQRRK